MEHQIEAQGPNVRRAHFNAGTAKNSSGASFAQDLRAWWFTQKAFSKQVEFSASLGVSQTTLQQWLTGRAFPSAALCDRLHAVTGLDCFSAFGRETARREHETKRGLSHAAIAKRAARQYVTPSEFDECRRDPEKAFTIHGDDWIVCLECGLLCKQLRATGKAAHLRDEHKMAADLYRIGPDPMNPRFGKRRALICNTLAKRKRESETIKNLRPDAGLANLRPRIKGSASSPEFSRKQSARMRGNRTGFERRDVPDIEFVWPWLIEDQNVWRAGQANGFTIGGAWRRLATIIGSPVNKKIRTEPSETSVREAVQIIRRSPDDAALKKNLDDLCGASAAEVAAGSDRRSRDVMLLVRRLRAWLQCTTIIANLSDADLARRFLADGAWLEPKRRRVKRKNAASRNQNRAGRPVTKRQIFEQAKRIRADETQRPSWSKLAQQLTPEHYKDNPRKAAEALRIGVGRLR